MRIKILTNKARGLYNKALIRIYEISLRTEKTLIPFPLVFEKICRNFSINKAEAWDYLRMFQELGFIEVIPSKGIRIKYKVHYAK